MEADVLLDLFDEFARRFARGEQPAVLDYLERAGDRADELAGMLDRRLGWGRRGLTRDVVVERLLALLGLRPERSLKVRRYYHELETGLLEPRGVDRRVWEALAQVLGASAADLAGWRPRRLDARPAFRMSGEAMLDEGAVFSSVLSSAAAEEVDEVDRLFTGSGR
jgi:hypothetical protein